MSVPYLCEQGLDGLLDGSGEVLGGVTTIVVIADDAGQLQVPEDVADHARRPGPWVGDLSPPGGGQGLVEVPLYVLAEVLNCNIDGTVFPMLMCAIPCHVSE